jgi:hypothetical protein
MGGSHYGIGDTAGLGSGLGDKSAGAAPWGDQSGSTLAHDAGIGDVGSSANRGDDNSRAGLVDTASNDDHTSHDDQTSNDDYDDHDDTDMDSDDFGGDGDSDYA